VWAWLRYEPAIANSRELRLRPEWAEIDPHQKTILGDEFGVAFGLCTLHGPLNVRDIADARHVIRLVLPRRLGIRSFPIRGPAKLPDFILTDTSNRLIIVECKGCQSSHSVLDKAMSGGVAQKGNVAARKGISVAYSLVTGLFIPPYNSQSYPILKIRDPDWRSLWRLISEVSVDRLVAATRRISIDRQGS
jgi:hypothetical protein